MNEVHDLIYCESGQDYAEIQAAIRKEFPQATFEDGSDYIHEYRFAVTIPDLTGREWFKFAILKGFALSCFGVQLATCKVSTGSTGHQDLVDALAELKGGKAAKPITHQPRQATSVLPLKRCDECCHMLTNGDKGHCYMFEVEPTGRHCGQFRRGGDL